MCIVIYTPAEQKPISEDDFKAAVASYSAGGCGVMWPNRDKKIVEVLKIGGSAANKDASPIYKKYVEVVESGLPAVIQCRSHGGPVEYAQPFVTPTAHIGYALNGGVTYNSLEERNSDAKWFTERFLATVTHEMLEDKAFGFMLAKRINDGGPSIIMTPEKEYQFGVFAEKYQGSWFSQKIQRIIYDADGGYYDYNGYYRHGPKFNGTKRAGVKMDGRDSNGYFQTIDDPKLVAAQFQKMMDDLKREAEELKALKAAVGITSTEAPAEKPKRFRKTKPVVTGVAASTLAEGDAVVEVP